jgi:hypothetical protein
MRQGRGILWTANPARLHGYPSDEDGTQPLGGGARNLSGRNLLVTTL